MNGVLVLFRPDLYLPVSQLQKLELDLGFSVLFDEIKFAEVFPTFWNLKHLKVFLVARHDENIFCLTSLICASPRLNSFTLKLRYDETSYRYLYELPNCEWRKSENRIHQCLKVVEFIGFYGYDSELDLVYYLFEKSVVLEKMIIDPKVRVIGKKWALVEQMENVSRTRAKLLQKYIPPGMEFMIL